MKRKLKLLVTIAGIRALGVDYETGSGLDRFAYDATTWGPVFGVSLKW